MTPTDLMRYCAARKQPDESLFQSAERLMLIEALRLSQGNQRQAAKLLCCSDRILNYKLDALGVRPKDQGRWEYEKMLGLWPARSSNT